MDFLNSFAIGLEIALSAQNLFYCFVGVFLGTFIGVLPGIGSLAAISMLLPATFYLDPATALIMLAGIYYGAEYGGSIASILLNIPGTTSSVVVCFDGHPLAKQGRAGVALFLTTMSSFLGASIGICVLMLFAPALARVALAFGPADYFSIMALGLLAAAVISEGSALKGVAMVVLGLILGCVGTDINSGVARFHLGQTELLDGINLIALAMGLFGITEVISSAGQVNSSMLNTKLTLRSMLPTKSDLKRWIAPALRGSGVGVFFGTLPGTGHTVASFMSYALEKKASKYPEQLGKGAIEGISAPEAANNAASQTAFIPTLTMGIPGSATMALMFGALMIHGIAPGPGLMSQHPDVFWGLTVSFWIGNVMLVILNLPMIGLWIRLLKIPYRYLYPTILVLICIGVYSIENSLFDIGTVLFFGIVGYALRMLNYPAAPLLIGFVLGPLMEENLRRAMLLSRGDFSVFIERPISACVIAITLGLIAWAIWSSAISSKRAGRKPETI